MIKSGGAGTELKNLIGWFAEPRESCNCTTLQELMDKWGIVGCRINKDSIVDALMNEAQERGWPSGKFSRFVATKLVNKAIANASR